MSSPVLQWTILLKSPFRFRMDFQKFPFTQKQPVANRKKVQVKIIQKISCWTENHIFRLRFPLLCATKLNLSIVLALMQFSSIPGWIDCTQLVEIRSFVSGMSNLLRFGDWAQLKISKFYFILLWVQADPFIQSMEHHTDWVNDIVVCCSGRHCELDDQQFYSSHW